MMTRDQIQRLLDFCQAQTDWQGEPGSRLKEDAIDICEAALAEPSAPVAVLDVSMQEHDRGQSLAPASPALKFARTVALPIAKDLPLGVYQLFTHPASKPAQLPELTDGEVVNILCADGCERIESFYHVGPVQKAAVWSFARAILAAARRVK